MGNNHNGAGRLRGILEVAAERSGFSMMDLTVLSKQNDPYRQDTAGGHAVGKRFADQVERFVPDGTVHLRGLHYRISSARDVLKGDGKPYLNTDADWVFLQEDASKAARWLRYVPWNRIVDQRNAAPQIYIPEAETTVTWEPGEGAFIQVPVSAEAALPRPTANFQPRQAYRLVLIGEKASLDSVLLPVAKAYGAELLLPTGEASETMIAELAARIAADAFHSLEADGIQGRPLAGRDGAGANGDRRHASLAPGRVALACHRGA